MKYDNSDDQTWFSRLANSWLGILLGLLLLAGGSVLLYWNEGRTQGANQALVEAQTAIVDVDEKAALNPDLEGQVVHISGLARAGTSLFDPLFGIEAKALRLRRSVEYYQWTEYTPGENTTQPEGAEENAVNAAYEREWTTYLVNSSVFRNPDYQGLNQSLANVAAQYWLAPDIRLGPYLLPDFLTARLNGEEVLELNLSAEQLAAAADNLGLDPAWLHQSNNGLYLGLNPDAPQVGDIRVRFSVIPPSEVSVIAQVSGDSLTSFTSSTGYAVSELRTGLLSAAEMVDAVKDDSVTINWLLRLLSYAAVLLGFALAFNPLSILVSILPVAGTIVGYRRGWAVFLLGLLWILLISGLSWLRVRPVMGVLALLATLIIVFMVLRRKRRRRGLADYRDQARNQD